MTDSGSHPTPRTLRDAVEQVIARAMRDCWNGETMPSPAIVTEAVVASFDIRPHNEPATARVPEDMTAEKLREAAEAVERRGGDGEQRRANWAFADELREWADEIAARDVGGDSPAEPKD